MQPSWTLARPFGIPLAIHLSWPPIFIFVTWSLAAQFFPVIFPEWRWNTHLSLAIVASVLLFGSVLAHELGHSLVAQRQGLAVRGITLFLFGGVAEIEHEARSPRDEFFLAAAGPAVSLLLAVLCGAIWYVAPSLFPTSLGPSTDAYYAAFSAVMLYLTVSNALLVLFNLIPALPLDGGRMVRALLWARGQDHDHATARLSWVGRGFGYLGVLGGLLWIFSGAFVTGFWFIALGLFLSNAARTGGPGPAGGPSGPGQGPGVEAQGERGAPSIEKEAPSSDEA